MFHMLTGTVPFPERDSMKLIHSHLVKKPPDVTTFRDDLHPMIPVIVQKLLQKDPKHRYQSARGLKVMLTTVSQVLIDVRQQKKPFIQHDLERCLCEVQEGMNWDEFALGVKDIGAIIEISNNMIAHNEELGTIMSALERVTPS